MAYFYKVEYLCLLSYATIRLITISFYSVGFSCVNKKKDLQKDFHEIHKMLKDEETMNDKFCEECYKDAYACFYVHLEKEQNLLKVLKFAKTFNIYKEDYSDSAGSQINYLEDEDIGNMSYEKCLEESTMPVQTGSKRSKIGSRTLPHKIFKSAEDVSMDNNLDSSKSLGMKIDY